MDELPRLSFIYKVSFYGSYHSYNRQKWNKVCISRMNTKFLSNQIYIYIYICIYIYTFIFFSDHSRLFCRLVSRTKWHYKNNVCNKKKLFTGSNEACQRYSYNLDEGRNSIWMKTAIYSECIGLRISNCIH